MQFWLDNVAAAIVLGVLMLILLATQARTQQGMLEQASFYAMRRQQVSFIETLERDLHNAYRLDDFGLSGTDSTFTFRTTLSANHADTVRVRYVLRRSGSAGTVPLYRLDRYERVGNAYTLRGGSPNFVTTLVITAQNHQAGSIEDLLDARQVHVSFELMTPWRAHLQRVSTIERVRWEMTYRPLMLHNVPRV